MDDRNPTSCPLRAVVFDLGGTLEETTYNQELRAGAAHDLLRFMIERGLDPHLGADEVGARVAAGMQACVRWREQAEMELPPERLWVEFVFSGCDLPAGRLADAGEELAFFYEKRFFRRALRPGAGEALDALAAHGYRLAVISNVMSRGLVPFKLAEYGIVQHFDPVLTSSVFGRRKPNEGIFLESARLMGLDPRECAYVGDTISRDVNGARRAGYGMAIQIKSFLTTKSDNATDVTQPDAVVQDLREILAVVEMRNNELAEDIAGR